MIIKPRGKPDPVEEKGDTVIMEIPLDRVPSNEWSEWFRNPTGDYEYPTNLRPKRCEVIGDRLRFPTDYRNAETHVRYVLKWMENANVASEKAEAEREKRAEAKKRLEAEKKERLGKLKEESHRKF